MKKFRSEIGAFPEIAIWNDFGLFLHIRIEIRFGFCQMPSLLATYPVGENLLAVPACDGAIDDGTRPAFVSQATRLVLT